VTVGGVRVVLEVDDEQRELTASSIELPPDLLRVS
jgi:hypothetical protein